MKERPIIFSGEMVRAILAGRKTQTRRVIKLQPPADTFEDDVPLLGYFYRGNGEKVGYGFCDEGGRVYKCPYGMVGDQLWVRETWIEWGGVNCLCRYYGDECTCDKYFYRADPSTNFANECEPIADRLKWKPSIFMPRWASRIQLKITSIRVERVQDITAADIHEEGVVSLGVFEGADIFQHLWDSINAKRGYGWQENPWVWVIEFEKI